MTEELREEFRRLSVPVGLRLPAPAVLVGMSRKRQRRHRAAVAVVVAAVVVAVVPALALVPGRPGPVPVAAEAPRLDGMEALACGKWPLSTLTGERGAESSRGAEAAGLRTAIATAQAPLQYPKSGWTLLGRDAAEGTVTFGNRRGDVGLQDVLTLKRNDAGAYVFAGSGGCGPLGFKDGRRATRLDTYTVAGRTLTLNWLGGVCGDGSEAEVVVDEQDDTVSVMLVPPPDGPGSCPQVGRSERTAVQLAAPLGTRNVVDAGYLPTLDLPSEAAYEAQIAVDSQRDTAARALCGTTAQALGGKPEVSYPETVGHVRDAVSAARSTWAGLSAQGPAAHCYLRQPDGAIWAYVASIGQEPVVLDRDFDRGGGYVKLPD